MYLERLTTPATKLGQQANYAVPARSPRRRWACRRSVVCLSSHDSCPALRANTLLVRLPLQDGQVPPPAELEDLTKLISSLLDEDKIVRVACDLRLNRSA
jgi:hypothetical protein